MKTPTGTSHQHFHQASNPPPIPFPVCHRTLPLSARFRPVPGPPPASQHSQLCPSHGRSCATGICQTTLWRDGGEHRKRVGGEIRSLSVRRSAGTSRVSRCLSAIKANELFHFVVSLVEKHPLPLPKKLRSDSLCRGIERKENSWTCFFVLFFYIQVIIFGLLVH